jgi:hypothetical protein
MKVNQRGSLPAKIVQAYVAAHPATKKTAVSPARKETPRRPAPTAKAPKAPKRRKTAASATKRAAQPATRTAPVGADSDGVTAPPAGSVDLAGGLRTYLSSVEAEVRAVSALAERTDALVTELNDVRDQQAKRLLVLDELRTSVTDQSLAAFLNHAIKPRQARVREIVPERLTQ